MGQQTSEDYKKKIAQKYTLPENTKKAAPDKMIWHRRERDHKWKTG